MSFGIDKIKTLTEPEPIDTANHIINGIAASNLITVYTLCTTEYSGRAEGGIDEGERIVVIKPESGTLLVHGEEGYKPINWQPSDANITADINEEGDVCITAETNESLTVTCIEVYQLTIFNNTDKATLQLKGTEEEMHKRILNNSELVEDGLSNLHHEKEFSFGRVDIFAEDENSTPVIIEVKRRPATRDHVYQLYTYVMEYNQQYSGNARGILVAPKCTNYIKEVLHSYDLEFVELEAV